MRYFTAYQWEGGGRTEKNQDSLALCQMVVRRKRCLMAVVCDGIGSLPESEKVSGFVTEQLVNWFFNKGPQVLARKLYVGTIKNIVNRELYRIRGELCQICKTQCGTTLSMLLMCEHDCWIWNVGDSRVYRGRGRRITVLTRDDVWKGMLTKCIGSFKWQGLYVKKGHMRRNDTFLVCTDGFYRMLSKDEMQMILSREISGEKQADKLLREVILRLRSKGEKDDMSAIYVGVGR